MLSISIEMLSIRNTFSVKPRYEKGVGGDYPIPIGEVYPLLQAMGYSVLTLLISFTLCPGALHEMVLHGRVPFHYAGNDRT